MTEINIVLIFFPLENKMVVLTICGYIYVYYVVFATCSTVARIDLVFYET